MKLQTRPRAILVTGGSHVRKPFLRKRRQRACTFWSRARIGLRGGVRARFSTASTMLHRSLNAVAHRRRRVRSYQCHRPRRLCKWICPILRRWYLWSAHALRDRLRTLTGSRTQPVRMTPSYRHCRAVPQSAGKGTCVRSGPWACGARKKVPILPLTVQWRPGLQ